MYLQQTKFVPFRKVQVEAEAAREAAEAAREAGAVAQEPAPVAETKLIEWEQYKTFHRFRTRHD